MTALELKEKIVAKQATKEDYKAWAMARIDACWDSQSPEGTQFSGISIFIAAEKDGKTHVTAGSAGISTDQLVEFSIALSAQFI